MMRETCFGPNPLKPLGTVDVEIIRHGDSELGFLNRHGKGHSVPPAQGQL